MDKIYLHGMEFYSYHGVFEEENRLGQRFVADVVLTADLRAAGAADDLQLSINYADVYDKVKKIMDGEPVQLIETLAERIAASILEGFPSAQGVQVKVTKPHPPICGVLGGVAVEIFRQRS